MFPKLNHGRPDKNSGYVSKGNDKDFLYKYGSDFIDQN